MLSRIGLSSRLARSSASGPHGYQSTGLPACWSKYGLVSSAKRLGIVRSVLERQFDERATRCIDTRRCTVTPTFKLYRVATIHLTACLALATRSAFVACGARRLV